MVIAVAYILTAATITMSRFSWVFALSITKITKMKPNENVPLYIRYTVRHKYTCHYDSLTAVPALVEKKTVIGRSVLFLLTTPSNRALSVSRTEYSLNSNSTCATNRIKIAHIGWIQSRFQA